MNYKNDLILKAARGEKTTRTPVWLMRQAGRILPEYRALREKLSGFLELVKTPRLAAEVTIQPVDRLEVDAAIIFSDILVIPEAMGLSYQMIEKKGPFFPRTIQNSEDLKIISVANPEDHLSYVLEAIEYTKKWLQNKVPLIGFAGAPWTIFAYMTEGKGSKTFANARKKLYADPDFSHQLLQLITDSTIAYLKAQIRHGADMVQLFDSWAGILPPDQYMSFSLPYISQICDSITEVPVTVFAKGGYFARTDLGKLNCEVIGLDWNMPVQESRKLIGKDKVLQGNLDPCTLYGSFDTIRKETKTMLNAFGNKHIANLGHGVYPDTDVEKVKCFVDAVKEFSTW